MKTMKYLLLLLITALAGAGWPESILGGEGSGQNSKTCRDCSHTARAVLLSALSEARSDYYLAIAKASTLSDPEARTEAMEEAKESYREEVALTREQHEARLEMCRILGECRYDPVIDPANFLTPAQIAAAPNPYWPMIPGALYRYRSITEDNQEEITEVRFTGDTRVILGVTCIVARDTVWLDGEVIEDTRDWYAQDLAGNVWYFGELTLEFENGEIQGLEGSFEAGVEGGKPGVIMKANPQVGDAYRQEMFLREAEDWAQVVALGQSVAVPFGVYNDCLQTANYNPTGEDPMSVECKYYAPGIGLVLEIEPSGERVELIAIEMESPVGP